MSRIQAVLAAVGVILLAGAATAWEYVPLNVSADDAESAWRDELCRLLSGKKEVSVPGGRIDILTADSVVELDRLHKWHEGIGQVLHYAHMTGKSPVLALMAYSRSPESLRTNTIRRLALVEKTCQAYGVHLLVLLPQKMRIIGENPDVGTETGYWINLRTGVRHRPGCRFYRNTAEGRPCGPDEGRPCSLCTPVRRLAQ